MPLPHLHVPGVDCAPDDFDSFAAMGVSTANRLQPIVRVPWVGIERRRHMLNEGANPAMPFPEVLAERDAAVEAGSLTLSAVTPAVDAGPHLSSSQRELGSAGACSVSSAIRVCTHAAQCVDTNLTRPSPKSWESVADPVNEGVA